MRRTHIADQYKRETTGWIAVRRDGPPLIVARLQTTYEKFLMHEFPILLVLHSLFKGLNTGLTLACVDLIDLFYAWIHMKILM